MDNIGSGEYDVRWSTELQTVGFVQYDLDTELDQMSSWDDDSYSVTHSVPLTGLLSPRTYYMRAVSYDNDNNMIVSALDTLVISGDEPSPVSAPTISIYPVPYNPGMGSLTMSNLPEGGSLIVVNGNGMEIYSKDIGTETTFTWDGSNRQGSPVMSGVYYVVVKDAGGTVVERRPIMIVN